MMADIVKPPPYSYHPEYEEYASDWRLLLDCYKGDRGVKDGGTLYLPETKSMREDGMATVSQDGYKSYVEYQKRAAFPDYVREAVQTMNGLVHRKPAVITLPPQLDYLYEHATTNGEGLQALLQKITEELLLLGRIGLLVDIQLDQNEPMVHLYRAPAIVNWDGETTHRNRRFVVLDQSGFKVNMDTLEWKYSTDVLTYRLKNGRVEALRNVDGVEEPIKIPNLSGVTLARLPFVFCNSTDLVAAPQRPPLLGLANISLTIYRAEADYRQTLFMQGQDTLVVQGASKPEGGWRVGAGYAITLEGPDADAKYIGIGSAGLMEQRLAMENDKREAAETGGRLLQSKGTQAESNEALQTRISARSATLVGMVRTAAAALVEVIKLVGEFKGVDTSEATVVPNTDFVLDMITGQDLNQMTEAQIKGAPISRRSVHTMLAKRDMTNLSFEDEMAQIEQEGPIGILTAALAIPTKPVK